MEGKRNEYNKLEGDGRVTSRPNPTWMTSFPDDIGLLTLFFAFPPAPPPQMLCPTSGLIVLDRIDGMDTADADSFPAIGRRTGASRS